MIVRKALFIINDISIIMMFLVMYIQRLKKKISNAIISSVLNGLT